MGRCRSAVKRTTCVRSRSTTPRPRVVAIALGEVGHVASERVVDARAAWRRGSASSRTAREERVAHLGHDGRAPQCVTQRGGRRRRRDGSRSSPAIDDWSSSTRMEPCCSSAPRSRHCALADELAPVAASARPAPARRSRARPSAPARAPPARRRRTGTPSDAEGAAQQGVDAAVCREQGTGRRSQGAVTL